VAGFGLLSVPIWSTWVGSDMIVAHRVRAWIEPQI
jgi:hypothetical protein